MTLREIVDMSVRQFAKMRGIDFLVDLLCHTHRRIEVLKAEKVPLVVKVLLVPTLQNYNYVLHQL